MRYTGRAGGHVEHLETTLAATATLLLTIAGPRPEVSGPVPGPWFPVSLQDAGAGWCTGQADDGGPRTVVTFDCWYSSTIVIQVESRNGDAVTAMAIGEALHDETTDRTWRIESGMMQGTLDIDGSGRVVGAQLSGGAGVTET